MQLTTHSKSSAHFLNNELLEEIERQKKIIEIKDSTIQKLYDIISNAKETVITVLCEASIKEDKINSDYIKDYYF